MHNVTVRVNQGFIFVIFFSIPSTEQNKDKILIVVSTQA
jgi:hypothetical protein